MDTVKFPGTLTERAELLADIAKNCACTFSGSDADRVVTSRCEPCKAFVSDQRFLNGLVVSRRRAAEIWKEEFRKGPPLKELAPYRWRGELEQ